MRLNPIWLPVIVLFACSNIPTNETATSTDTVKTEIAAPVLKEFTFSDDEFLKKPMNLNLGDTASVRKIATSYAGFSASLSDGRPWYTFHAFDGAMKLSYYDFYDNNDRRFYLDDVATSDPAIMFSKGIHVGMSKDELRKVFKLEGPKSEEADVIIISTGNLNKVPGEYIGRFEFGEGLLKTVQLTYSYAEFPHLVTDLANSWTSIVENEGEGQVEQFQECEPFSFSLEEYILEGPEEITGYLLNKGMVMDSRTDTVRWIRSTGDGLMIMASNSQGFGPYTINITFKDKDWNTADWDGKLFMVTGMAQQLMKDCGAGDGSGEGGDVP